MRLHFKNMLSGQNKETATLHERQVWVPLLWTLLLLTGLTLAVTDTSIGPADMYLHGHLVPWWDGAFLAVLGLVGFAFSLWWYWLPQWEQRYAEQQTEIVVAGRHMPARVFSYSLSDIGFVVAVSMMIAAVGAIGNRMVLFTLLLPALVLGMKLLTGREFVAVTAEGLAWRVMPQTTTPEASTLRARDVFTRQPVQFLPWNVVSDVRLAEAMVMSGNGRLFSVPMVMLSISVPDPAALAGLTHYQRIIPQEAGADVLIPVGWRGPRAQQPVLGVTRNRAQPEAVWEAVSQAWQRLETPKPTAAPVVHAVLDSALQDLRHAAQHAGTGAYKAGQALAGAVLGVPFFAVIVLLSATGHLPGGGSEVLAFMMGYMLLIVLPGCACLSSAIAALASPDGQEQRGSRTALQLYVSSIATLAVITLSLAAWQYFDPANPHHTTFNIPWLIGGFVLSLLGLWLGSEAGLRLGLSAKQGTHLWLANLLRRLL